MKNKIHLLVIFNHILSGYALYSLSPRYLWFTLIGWFLFGKIGGEIGLHRYFAHHSFKCSSFVEFMFLIFGSLNCFGPPLAWVGVHRKHHHHPDTEQDPHGSQAFWRIWLTVWKPFKIETRSISDLISDSRQKFFYSNYFPFIVFVFAGLALIDPWLPIYLISLPAVITFHSAGMVNSICHRWGYRRFDTSDRSHNNFFVNLLTLGSGLHNNHHAYPKNYYNAYKWYELDVPGLMIRYLFKIN